MLTLNILRVIVSNSHNCKSKDALTPNIFEVIADNSSKI